MSEEQKSERPKLDARGRASVFHLEDGWLRRAPIDAREIVARRQGVAVPSRVEFVAWATALPAGRKGEAARWPADAGERPHWFHEALVAAGAAEAVPAGDPDAALSNAAPRSLGVQNPPFLDPDN